MIEDENEIVVGSLVGIPGISFTGAALGYIE